MKSEREVFISKNHINQVEIDCVIFGYENKQLKVLISKLKFKGEFFSLHSGYIKQEENIDIAAKRILENRTGIKGIYLEEFMVFGNVDKRRKEFLDSLIALNYKNKSEFLKKKIDVYNQFSKRHISIGYYALADINKVKPALTKIDKSINWWPIQDVPPLIMHYDDVLKKALMSLKEDINQKFNAFNLLPEKFTMKEIQAIYETIFEKKYTRSNFQKKILEMNVLERLEKKFTGAKNKAPYLYRKK